MAFQPKTYTKKINGNEYKAQFNGLQACLEAFDSCSVDNTGRISISKISKYVLEHVIVEPKLCVNDFANLEELNEVVAFGTEVMKGSFRQED